MSTVSTTSIETETIEKIRLEAERLRILNLKALQKAGSGHPGGTLSLADVISVLYFGGVLRYDPTDPTWTHRDRLVLSEGHTAPILYSALTEAGFKGWSEETLMNLRKDPDAIAQGHVTRGLTPGIDCSTGALGMGGSKALGMALAARYNGYDYHTFAILGDGESQEGQVYEAAANSALLGVDNMTWILNRNKAQQTCGISDLSSVQYEKWFDSLGWNVVVLNGESAEPEANRVFINQLRETLLKAKQNAGKAKRPTVVIVDTIKGKGVGFMEYTGQKPGDYKFHGVAPTSDELARALPEIEARLGSYDAAALKAYLKVQVASNKEDVNRKNATSHDTKRSRQMVVRKQAPTSTFPNYKPTDKPAATREGFGKALTYLSQVYPEVVATAPDLQDSVQMFGIEKATGRQSKENHDGAYFPEGISESNAFGKAAGLGYESLIPFVATFDNFILEAADEMQHAAAYGSFYVAVGTHSGCGVGPDGKSQMGVAGPGIVDDYSGPDGSLFEMFEPADSQEAAEITKLIVERTRKEGNPGHPIYLRLTRHNIANLDRSTIKNYSEKLLDGSYVVPVPGVPENQKPDVLVVACGAVMMQAYQAAIELAKEKIYVKLVNVVSLNKIQRETSSFVRESLVEGVPVVTAHDAQPHALAHRVLEAMNVARCQGKQPGILLKSLGADVSPKLTQVGSGTTEENYRRNLLDTAGILATLKQLIKK